MLAIWPPVTCFGLRLLLALPPARLLKLFVLAIRSRMAAFAY